VFTVYELFTCQQKTVTSLLLECQIVYPKLMAKSKDDLQSKYIKVRSNFRKKCVHTKN